MKQFTRIFVGGDVCGEIGLNTLEKHLPTILEEENIDFCIVNGENTSNGIGLKYKDSSVFFDSGVDVITGGNHTLEKFDIRYNFGKDKRILRPHNFPYALGSGVVTVEKAGITYTVMNMQGRVNMRTLDCPFQTADRIFEEYSDCDLSKSINIMDFHADSTMEKEALAFYLDGRISLFVGTHTHTQTADERILPKGCAYITDLGMFGAKDSSIGGDAQAIIQRTKTQVPQKMSMDTSGVSIICGLIAEIDTETRTAKSVKRIFQKFDMKSLY